MAVIQVKKYKTIKDENGNKIKVLKTKEEWNKETKNGTATWYFSERYEINGVKKQYKSALFPLKRIAEDERSIFKNNPIEYIKTYGKRSKINTDIIYCKNIEEKTLNEYFIDFTNYHIEFTKGSTVFDYKDSWKNHISDMLGGLTPSQITLAITQEWYEYMNKKVNPRTQRQYATATKNKVLAALSEFYQYLYKNGLIEINYLKVLGPFKNSKVNKNEKKKIKFQTLEEFNLFMSVVDDDFWYAFFNFLFWHGPRIGEQRALKIEDVDLKSDLIDFHNTFTKDENGKETIGSIKNGKNGKTYLAEQSKSYIKNLISKYKQMDGYADQWYLFGGAFPLTKNMIQRKLDYYYNKLKNAYPDKNINSLTHHEFGRHSHASFLLNVGCDRDDIYFIIAERLRDTPEVIKSTYAEPYKNLNNNKSKLLLSEENINQKLKIEKEENLRNILRNKKITL